MKKIITPLIPFLLYSTIVICKTDIEITEGLKSGTFQKKIELINRIENSKNKVYLPNLGEIITTDENEEIRSRATLALLNIGDATCIPYFRDALGDSYWQVRLYGIKGLVKYGTGENIIPDLKRAIKDSYWQVRYYAATGFGKYGDERILPDLLGCVQDTNETVKAEVLWAMLTLMGRDEARAMFKKFPEDKIRPVLNILKSTNPELKIRTLWLLEATGDKRAIPYFIEMLSDKDDEVKIRALWAIEKFRSEEGGKEIEGLLVDESTKIKIEAIKTLVNLKMTEGTAGLIKGLSDNNESVKIYSLWTLEKFREPASYPYITECLGDNSERVREYAGRLIVQIRDPLFYSPLKNFIEDTNKPFDARISAISLLGKIGNETVKEFILKLMDNPESDIRCSAIRAFYNIDRFDTQYLKILAYVENYDSSSNVRKEAINLTGNITKQMQIKLASPEKDERQFVLDRIEYLVGASALRGILLNMSYSKYLEVREKMLLIVKENPEKIFGANVRRMLDEKDISIKKLAAIAAGEIKDRESIPLLKGGLKSVDPEFQLICARSLANMGISDGFPLAVRYMDSKEPNYQRISAETLALLKDKKASSVLLRHLADSELDVKVVSAWALARMGEEKGIDLLVRLSEEGIEPVRTSANKYLLDPEIPLSMRNKIPSLRERVYIEKLGIREVSPKRLTAIFASSPVEIDGFNKEGFWLSAEKADMFIEQEKEKIKTSVVTTVKVAYDTDNIYLFFICEDPDTSKIDFNSRDIITVSINPLNSAKEWYQFVLHPLEHIKYSYVWKLYKDDEPERLWTSTWKVKSNIESKRWLVEISIPLKDLKVEKISSVDIWSINFQRESQNIPDTSWSGRIDNPAQFGILYFKEQ
ncbi:MAG: HEAT repeat domain-containing protein [Candidatus Omnitrophica bacterium]|nr:HEAT repeat domain-containing protein [Candidatus Omnitrophota bacterium]MCM8777113.1 HEAT repeat domain-containing protein [Candidatus Omnitrophota bacterium]